MKNGVIEQGGLYYVYSNGKLLCITGKSGIEEMDKALKDLKK